MMYVSKGREYCSTLGIFVPPKGLCNTSQLVCFQSPQEAMKIRTITVGLQVQPEDFVEVGGTHAIGSKLLFARRSLDDISNSLKSSGYEVQTLRISLNSFEQWLLLDDQSYGNGCGIASYIDIVEILVHYLTLYSIELCSIGCCSSSHAIALIPSLLAVSERLSCSALFRGTKLDDITPDDVLIKAAARTLISVAKTLGVAGCFRYCASFNCAGGLPFFPAAFFESDGTSDSSDRGVAVKEGFLVSVGLECADLLFIAFHGALSASEGSRNLSEVMMQALLPIQNIVSTSCTLLNIEYGGIDASINPGMSLPESVAAGLENLLFIPELPKNLLTPAPAQQFGEFGTLAAVSAVTKAVKSLASRGIKLTGYNGLMLPVMEDVILAARAAQQPPTYTMRDLLMFSSVCGVGLDTVPVPGDITMEKVAAIYTETAALAFRLNKPLSCRLLVMDGKVAGDMTDVVHSCIINTRVFQV